MMLALLALGGALVGLTIWRPAIGCCVLALGIPLLTGLGRNTVVPLLRPNEALLLVVAIGLMAHYLPRRRSLPVTGLDLLIGCFAVGLVLIPSLLLFVTHGAWDFDRVRLVFGPLQFLMVYTVFSRAGLSERSLAICLNLALLASVIVGLIAVIQLTGVSPGFRRLLETYYPPEAVHAWDPVDRPTSLLGHFSSVGAFAALNYTLALALAATKHPGFSATWLSLVMGVNVAAVLASLTLAPAIGLLPVTLVIIWYARRVPRQLMAVLAAGVLALVLLAPFFSTRLNQQHISLGGVQELKLPQSLDFRIALWNEFFIPTISRHVWLGTGTVIPSEIPTSLTQNVDNEYLGMMFRAGIPGLGLLISLLVGLAFAGWHSRSSSAAWRRSLGGAVLGYAVLIATIGIAAEYITYGGVSQHIAMVVGLLVGAARPHGASSPESAVQPAVVSPGLRLALS